MAAVPSLLLSIVIVAAAGSEVYGRLAAALASGGVIVAICYQVFSKYALVVAGGRSLIVLFGRAQLLIIPIVIVTSLLFRASLGGSMVLYTIVGSWAISQGIKQFLGEVLRGNDIVGLYTVLYVSDSMLTLGLSCIVVWISPSVVALISVSALSSLACTAAILVPTWRTLGSGSPVTVRAMLGYSSPIVVSGVLNAGFIAIVRVGINQSGGAALGGMANFLYDLIQKPYALVSSSLVSVAVPRSKTRVTVGTIRSMGFLYLGAFFGISAFAIGFCSQILWSRPEMPTIVVGLLVAAIVFMNRFRAGFVELPFLLQRRPQYIVLGNAIAFLGGIFFVPGSSLEETLIVLLGLQIVASVIAMALMRGTAAASSGLIARSIVIMVVVSLLEYGARLAGLTDQINEVLIAITVGLLFLSGAFLIAGLLVARNE